MPGPSCSPRPADHPKPRPPDHPPATAQPRTPGTPRQRGREISHATDLLQQILARDDAPRSATTLLREQADPATQLGVATQRYVDALHVAIEDVVGRHTVHALDAAADRVVRDCCCAGYWLMRALMALIVTPSPAIAPASPAVVSSWSCFFQTVSRSTSTESWPR